MREDAGTAKLGMADVEMVLRDWRVPQGTVRSWHRVQLAHLRRPSLARGRVTGEAGTSNVA